jgi:hypothetical protein
MWSRARLQLTSHEVAKMKKAVKMRIAAMTITPRLAQTASLTQE